LRTAAKPDSQDVCFVLATEGGRSAFLGDRIPLRPGRVVDRDGRDLGTVDAVELVTVGQRRGLSEGGGEKRYALSVDTATATVVAGTEADLLTDAIALTGQTWTHRPLEPGARIHVQTSAHGDPQPATYEGEGAVVLLHPSRRVAPGQTVALYRDDEVAGAGIAG
jgi:tRNA-specific 2-thiouridylase